MLPQDTCNLSQFLKLCLEGFIPLPSPAIEHNVNSAPWSCAAS